MNSRGNFIGADVATAWYQRNTRIYSNIIRKLSGDEGCTFIMFGTSHIPILEHLFSLQNEFVIVNVPVLLNQQKLMTKALILASLIVTASMKANGQSRVGLGLGLTSTAHQDLTISPLLSKGTGLSTSFNFQRDNTRNFISTSLSFGSYRITSAAGNASNFTSIKLDVGYYRKVFNLPKDISIYVGGYMPISFFVQNLNIQSSQAGSFNHVTSGSASMGIAPAIEIRKATKNGWWWANSNLLLASLVIRPGHNQSPPATVSSDEPTISEILSSASFACPSTHLYWSLQLGYHGQLSKRSAFELAVRNSFQKISIPSDQAVYSLNTSFVVSYQYIFRKRV